MPQFGIRSPIKLSLTWVQEYHIRHVRIFFHGTTAPSGQGPPHYRLHYHTQTHHTRQDSPGQVISPTQKSQADNIKHSQETVFHALGGIWTQNSTKLTAPHTGLRWSGHWDRPHRDHPTYFIIEVGNKLKYSRKIKKSLIRRMPRSYCWWDRPHRDHPTYFIIEVGNKLKYSRKIKKSLIRRMPRSYCW